MAGDWIKMRCNLWDDPRVGRLCDATGQPEAMVIGGLYWLWAIADQHSTDGLVTGLSIAQINRKTGIKDFGEALCELEWIEDRCNSIVINRFEEHNGASAKKRCLTARRVAMHRAGNEPETNGDDAGNAGSVTGALAREDVEKKELSEEADASSSSPAKPTTRRGEVPCPYDEIIAVYHELLPMLPSVRIVSEKRKREMRKRWAWVLSSRKQNGERRATSADEAIRWFREYFGRCAGDPFINGQAPRAKGHEGWEADISYLMRDECLVRIAEKTGRVAA